ncbi:LacI family DNA-binding transcriptional regulator [Roseibium sp.]|uniref:LacI family DNA-binding transcriptional regulator n=1 Tax=Roseibium sp. TaxID=1936156 RepID=UPI003A97AF4C
MSGSRSSVTIDDVARHLGVAKGTVSRVLNNYTDISPATRERVLKAVKELGYQPSSTARSLKKGRQDTLGIVLPVGRGRGADPFLAEFVDGVARALDELDRDLLITTAHSARHMLDTHERLIARRKVDGFILTRTEVNDPRIEFLQTRRFPFVAHGRTADPSGFAWLDIDNEKTFVEGVAHLVKLGHRRIGFLGGPRDLNFACQRRAGYRRGLAEAGLNEDSALEVELALTEEGGVEGARQLLGLYEPPTALFCITDALAIGAMRLCRDLGLRVGEDVTVIGYDGLPVGAYVDPPLTTFSQSALTAGGQIARMLIDVIEGTAPADRQELAQAELIRRSSDGPPARTPEELAKMLRRSV